MRRHKTYIIDENNKLTPFAYKRPRPFIKALGRFVWRLIRRNSRRIARIIIKSLISGVFVAAGIIAGLTVVGLLCFFCGICLASCQEDTQTPEEYRQAVVAHYQARGKVAPRWTRKVTK